MRVMLVEDEYLLNKAISRYLSMQSINVDTFLNGLDAIDALSAEYDLFILDVDIPQINGIEILEQIYRLYPTIPVIMISATIDMSVITKAYEKGCSDYLKKPFDIKELELKIKALTRSKEEIIKLDDNLYYNRDKKEITNNGVIFSLTVKENKFLNLLVSNRGKIVSHSDIEVSVWGLDAQNVHLRQLLNRLRTKLPKNLIQNRVGEGYMIL
mgnify:CR=1 FL=1